MVLHGVRRGASRAKLVQYPLGLVHPYATGFDELINHDRQLLRGGAGCHASRSKVDIELYRPVLLSAWACAPASTARVSFPVAKTTAVMPFMIPLL